MVLDPEARRNHVPPCVQFTLSLPLDSRTHTVVGTGLDTIGDIIWKLEPDRWNESKVVITMEAPGRWEELGTGFILSWSDRVLETVAPGALITVSLPLRAQAIPGRVHKEMDPTSTIPRIPRPPKDPLVEMVYSASGVGWRAKLMPTSRHDCTLSRSAQTHEHDIPGALVIDLLNTRTCATPCRTLARPDQGSSWIGPILSYLTGPLVDVCYSAADGWGGARFLLVPNSATPRDISWCMSLCDPSHSPEVYLTLNGKVVTALSLNQPLSATSLTHCRLQLMCRLRGGMQPAGHATPEADKSAAQEDHPMSSAPGPAISSSGNPNTSHLDWLCLRH
jgi:hypothetical protein